MASSFASPADLITLSPGISEERACLILEMVSNGIRAGLNWGVDQFTGTKVVRPAVGEQVRYVSLPARHVTEVAVTVDAQALTEDTGYFLWAEEGQVQLQYPTCGIVEVTFTAGWTKAQRPPIFEAVCLEWAVLYAANPTNLRSYTMGKTSETFAASGSSALVIEDQRLAAYSLGPGF